MSFMDDVNRLFSGDQKTEGIDSELRKDVEALFEQNKKKDPDAPSESYIRWMKCDGNCGHNGCKCDRNLASILPKLTPNRLMLVEALTDFCSTYMTSVDSSLPPNLAKPIISDFGKSFVCGIMELLDLTAGIDVRRGGIPDEIMEKLIKAKPDPISYQTTMVMMKLHACIMTTAEQHGGSLGAVLMDGLSNNVFQLASVFAERLVRLAKQEAL